MKLYYYHAPDGNFGDDLNAWLWPKLIPGLSQEVCFHDWNYREANERERSLLVGFGTILDKRLPQNPKKLICGGGVGYNDIPRPDATWDVRFLRGHLTAEALGLPGSNVITDGAVMLRLIDLPQHRKYYDFSLMPYHRGMASGVWQRVARELGINLIDPRQDVETVLRELGQTKVLIAEAMHGAIVADALRIPWIPISSYPDLNSFKWRDWAGSLNVEYHPNPVMNSWGDGRNSNWFRNLVSRVRISAIKKQLSNIMKENRYYLSSDESMNMATERLEKSLDDIKRVIEKEV